jgi:hypothetical protein
MVAVLLSLLLLFGNAPDTKASRGPAGETIHIAVTGNDDGLWFGPGNGGGFSSLGGIGLYTPAVGLLQTSPNAFVPLYVTVGNDDGLWVRTAATNWQPLSSQGSICVDQPGMLTEGGQDGAGWFTNVWVACIGEDGAVYYASATTRGSTVPVFGGWTHLGGIAVHGVSVARVGGAVTFLVNGTDGSPPGSGVWTRTTATDWTRTPWGCVGTPALGSAYGKAWFACQGPDQGLWYARHFGSSWTGAASAGGLVDGPPAVAVTLSGATFEVRSGDGAVWENFTPNEGGPGGWSWTGGGIPDQLGVAAVGTTPIPS